MILAMGKFAEYNFVEAAFGSNDRESSVKFSKKAMVQ